jgi:hypothetical protein
MYNCRFCYVVFNSHMFQATEVQLENGVVIHIFYYEANTCVALPKACRRSVRALSYCYHNNNVSQSYSCWNRWTNVSCIPRSRTTIVHPLLMCRLCSHRTCWEPLYSYRTQAWGGSKNRNIQSGCVVLLDWLWPTLSSGRLYSKVPVHLAELGKALPLYGSELSHLFPTEKVFPLLKMGKAL